MTEDILIILLRQVKEVLDKHNIKFWLECGTLLGAVREEKFLSWEDDIDLGTWKKDVSKNAKEAIACELRNRGLKVYIFKNHMNIKKEKVHADINLYHMSNNKAIMLRYGPKSLKDRILYYFAMVLTNPYKPGLNFKELSFIKKLIKGSLFKISCIMPFWLRNQLARIAMAIYKRFGEKDVSWIVPSDYFINLLIIKFYGMEFRVPVKTKEYLSYRYGKNWQTPKKNWVTARDDGAVANTWRK